MNEQQQKKLETVEQLREDQVERPLLVEHNELTDSERAAVVHEQAKTLESARLDIESAESESVDNPIDRLQKAEQESEAASVMPSFRESPKIVVARELRDIRRKLSKTERTGSKIVHQPVVQAISEVSSKSISRPSGLLGGGILAFIGSAGYLYFTKHIGVQYNYFIFLMLFVGGFVVGLVLELIVWLISARARTQSS